MDYTAYKKKSGGRLVIGYDFCHRSISIKIFDDKSV